MLSWNNTFPNWQLFLGLIFPNFSAAVTCPHYFLEFSLSLDFGHFLLLLYYPNCTFSVFFSGSFSPVCCLNMISSSSTLLVVHGLPEVSHSPPFMCWWCQIILYHLLYHLLSWTFYPYFHHSKCTPCIWNIKFILSNKI